MDTARVGRTPPPTGSGEGICTLGSTGELEVGDENIALATTEAELGDVGARYRSAKLAQEST